jgi:hypothetical protein
MNTENNNAKNILKQRLNEMRAAKTENSTNTSPQLTPQEANEKMFADFIDMLIGDNAADMEQDELETMRRDIRIEIDDALNRAVLHSLPESALIEIEDLIDGDDEMALAVAINEQMDKHEVDKVAVTTEVFQQFIKLYRPSALEEDFFEDAVHAGENDPVTKQPNISETPSRNTSPAVNVSAPDGSLDSDSQQPTIDEIKALSDTQINEKMKTTLAELEGRYKRQFSMNNADDAKDWGHSLLVEPILDDVKNGRVGEAFIRFHPILTKDHDLGKCGAFLNLLNLLAVKLNREGYVGYESLEKFSTAMLARYLSDTAADMISKNPKKSEKEQIGKMIQTRYYCTALRVLTHIREFSYAPIVRENDPIGYLMWVLTEMIKRLEAECEKTEIEFQKAIFHKDRKKLYVMRVEEVLDSCPDLEVAKTLLKEVKKWK